MPTLTQGDTIGQVAEIIHAAVVLGPAAWGREPMPEAHMAADIEEKLKSQLIALFGILHERKISYLLVGDLAQKIGLYESDIYVLYALERPEIDPMLEELSPFVAPSQLAELRDIFAEIKSRIARLDRAKNSNS